MKNVWELLCVIQDEIRMMDPVTWHARKPEGKISPSTPLISLLPVTHQGGKIGLSQRREALV